MLQNSRTSICTISGVASGQLQQLPPPGWTATKIIVGSVGLVHTAEPDC